MAITDSAMTVPKYEQDKILNTSQNSLARANTIGTSASTVASPLTEPTFLVGVFSYDGGVTWNDFAPIFNFSSSPIPYLSSIVANADGSISIGDNQVSAMGGAYTVLRRWAHIARPDNSDFPESAYQFVKGKAYTSSESYMKIAKEGTIPFSSRGSVSIAHGLGYIPMVQVWYKGSSGAVGRPIVALNAFDTPNDAFVKVDENNVTIAIGNFNTFPGTAYYRIYYEG